MGFLAQNFTYHMYIWSSYISITVLGWLIYRLFFQNFLALWYTFFSCQVLRAQFLARVEIEILVESRQNCRNSALTFTFANDWSSYFDILWMNTMNWKTTILVNYACSSKYSVVEVNRLAREDDFLVHLYIR